MPRLQQRRRCSYAATGVRLGIPRQPSRTSLRRRAGVSPWTAATRAKPAFGGLNSRILCVVWSADVNTSAGRGTVAQRLDHTLEAYLAALAVARPVRRFASEFASQTTPNASSEITEGGPERLEGDWIRSRGEQDRAERSRRCLACPPRRTRIMPPTDWNSGRNSSPHSETTCASSTTKPVMWPASAASKRACARLTRETPAMRRRTSATRRGRALVSLSRPFGCVREVGKFSVRGPIRSRREQFARRPLLVECERYRRCQHDGGPQQELVGRGSSSTRRHSSRARSTAPR